MNCRLLFLSILVCFTLTARAENATIDLSGQWRFAMDPNDAGAAGQWFDHSLPDKINLPGILLKPTPRPAT
jgi:hypothetical protein